MEAVDVTSNVDLVVIAIVLRTSKGNVTRRPLEMAGTSPQLYGVPIDGSQRRRLEVAFQRTSHII